MRSGVIAKKLGMTRVYNDAGEHVPVTVLRMENCQVVAQRTDEKNGYTAVQLGVGLAKVKNTSKAMRGHFATASVEPKAKVVEFRVSTDNMLDVGAEITVDHFVAGQKVDVTGTTIGKGFQGVIKRHHFGGGRATPRQLGVAPYARFDRPAPGSGQGVQGQEDGRPPGFDPRDHAERRGGFHRRRSRPDPDPRRGSGLEGRMDTGPRRRQGCAAGERAEAGCPARQG